MYGKHFSSTYTGSMIGAGLNVFAVWGYVIANTIKSRVELNPRLLAMILGCKEEEIINAIAFLEKPDPKSRSKKNDGRRLIREGEYQYFIPTHEIYRSILNEDERREYNRLKQAEHRAKIKKEEAARVKESVNDKQDMSKCQGVLSAVSAHTDTDTEAEAEAEAEEREGITAPSSSSKKRKKQKYTIEFDFETRLWLGITTDDLKGWQQAFPAVDIQNHLNRMKEWLLSNPTKKKINYRRFITNWLLKEQDRPSGATLKSREEKLQAWAVKRAAELKEEEAKEKKDEIR